MFAALSTTSTNNPGTGPQGLNTDETERGRHAPVQSRSERFSSFDVADFATVTGKEADWKLSPIDRFESLLSGTLDGSPYALEFDENDGVTVEWVDRNDESIARAGTPEERASANAWSSFEKALAVRIEGTVAKEIIIRRAGFGSTPRAAHTTISAAPFSSAIIILAHSGDAFLTENVEITLGDGAHLTVVSVHEWEDTAVHLSSHFASVGRDASLNHTVVSLGGAVVRVNPTAHLVGTGSNADLFGVYFADAGQHLEHRVFVNHVAANTRSRVNYKGALRGDAARTVWIGDVLIGPHAIGTDSYEQNRNLLLTDGARADSVPNLEIETGDIVGAGHASATGRFDDEQLFYLQSRGIADSEAKRLVVRGFLTEIVEHIGVAGLEAHLLEAIEAELFETTGP